MISDNSTATAWARVDGEAARRASSPKLDHGFEAGQHPRGQLQRSHEAGSPQSLGGNRGPGRSSHAPAQEHHQPEVPGHIRAGLQQHGEEGLDRVPLRQEPRLQQAPLLLGSE